MIDFNTILQLRHQSKQPPPQQGSTGQTSNNTRAAAAKRRMQQKPQIDEINPVAMDDQVQTGSPQDLINRLPPDIAALARKYGRL
jgi:hypothetical protein